MPSISRERARNAGSVGRAASGSPLLLNTGSEVSLGIICGRIIRTGALARRTPWRGRALCMSGRLRLRLARASSRLPHDGGAGSEQNLRPHREREQAFERKSQALNPQNTGCLGALWVHNLEPSRGLLGRRPSFHQLLQPAQIKCPA